MMYFRRMIPLSDWGFGRAVAQYRLNRRFFTPVPSPGEVLSYPTGTPMWWKIPKTFSDGTGGIIGARSGLLIPAHDIAPGRYGPDSKDFNGNDRDMPDEDIEDDWLG